MNYYYPEGRGLLVTIKKDESGAIVVVAITESIDEGVRSTEQPNQYV